MRAPSNQRGRLSETSSVPPEKRYPGEVLSQFHDGSGLFRVELRCGNVWGTEVLVFENDALEHRRRFFTRELAVQWAEALRDRLLRKTAH